MSTIVIFGATGRIGSRVVAEGIARGQRVIAVVRDGTRMESISPDVGIVRGDVSSADSIRTCAVSADVVLMTIGGPDKTIYARAAHAAIAAAQAIGRGAPRIIHLGGGGSLLNDEGVRFVDAPGFPESVIPEGLGQSAALDVYRNSVGAAWTYLSPPPGNFAPGVRTGLYRTGLDHPVVAADGTASMSFEDAAVAIIDEIEVPRFIDERFTIGY
jgi:putative NADH-flavin reductase